MKIGRVSRVVRILTALQSGEGYTADDLAKMFDISRRTVFRDLKDLAAVGVPYRYESSSGSYTVDPEFFLPPIDLNLQEALGLLLLVHKGANLVQLPYRSSALIGALKIENNLPVKVRRYCNTMLEQVTTSSGGQAKMNGLDEVFVQLQQAVGKKQKLEIEYDSFYEKKVIITEIWPYHLLYSRRAWYVLGWSNLHDSVRMFKLNRIKSVRSQGQCYIDNDFDLYEYLGRAWSLIPEGKLYNVKLRFLPKVARNVAEVHWHGTQESHFQDDGSVLMDFRVDGLGEISWWIMGYGDQVEVLRPASLRKKIRETAGRMAALNGEG